MSSAISFILEPYNDLAHTATAFMDKFEFAATNVSTGLPFGLMNTLLSAQTFTERFHTDPIILEPLGPIPVRQPNEAQATFTGRKDDWKDLRDQIAEYTKGENAARTGLVAALSDETLTKVLDGSDIRTITLLELVTNFKTKIIIKKEALAAHQVQLEATFNAGDKIATHCNKHVLAHRAHRDYNEDLSSLARFTLLAKSLGPSGLFKHTLDTFATKPDDEQTFESLAAAAKAWVLTPSYTEAAERGYANAVATAAATQSNLVPTQLDTIQAQLASFLAQAAVQLPPPISAQRKSTPRKHPGQHAPVATVAPITGPTHYCWTHGHNYSHTGSVGECYRPARGHQTTATATNTMGGSQRVYTR